ncbi:hypothetical protein DL96DRAFT_112085 [Flagelloscypha sp. PMI_526]|nr:hypothetical protein DL96DRAFT_112085 [Flagelloscypha sp. PMI_526]
MTSSRLPTSSDAYESQKDHVPLSLSDREDDAHKVLPKTTLDALPLDVVGEIVRISVQQDGMTQARSLSLVSYPVQQWTDPLLFSSIHYDDSQFHTDDSDSESLNHDFWTFLSSPRFSRISHLISSFYINASNPRSLPSTSSLLAAIPGLKHLFIEDWASLLGWGTSTELIDTNSSLTVLEHMTRIETLHIYGEHSRLLPPIQNLTHTLTHLSLYHPITYSSNPDPWETTTGFPSLRILLVSATTVWPGSTGILRASQDWLSKLHAPSLELVLWQYPLTVWSWEVVAQNIHHPKLVFVVSPSTSRRPAEIPPEKLWPFIPVPEGYIDEKNHWSFGQHFELVQQGLDLMKARRDRERGLSFE